MNVTPINNYQTNPTTDSFPLESETINPAVFENQLFLAQEDVDWYTKTEARVEEKRIQEEQAEKERANKKLEEDKILEVSALAFRDLTNLEKTMEQNQVDQTKSEKAVEKVYKDSTELNNTWSEKLSLKDMVHDARSSAMAQENSQLKAKESFAEFKEIFTDQAIQDKVNTRKAHLLTPVLQINETGEEISTGLSDLPVKNGDDHSQNPKFDFKQTYSKHETENADQQRKLNVALFNNMSRKITSSSHDSQKTKISNIQENEQSSRNHSRNQFTSLSQRKLPEGLSLSKATAKTPSKTAAPSDLNPATTSETLKAETVIQGKNMDAKVSEPVNVKEVISNVRIMLSAGKSEMVMKLRPEHLGKLEIKLRKVGDKLTGRFKVENSKAKRILESQLPQLQQGLEEQGIHIEEFSVLVNEDSSAASSFAFNEGQSQQENITESHVNNAVPQNAGNKTVESSKHADAQPESGVSIYI